MEESTEGEFTLAPLALVQYGLWAFTRSGRQYLLCKPFLSSVTNAALGRNLTSTFKSTKKAANVAVSTATDIDSEFTRKPSCQLLHQDGKTVSRRNTNMYFKKCYHVNSAHVLMVTKLYEPSRADPRIFTTVNVSASRSNYHCCNSELPWPTLAFSYSFSSLLVHVAPLKCISQLWSFMGQTHECWFCDWNSFLKDDRALFIGQHVLICFPKFKRFFEVKL